MTGLWLLIPALMSVIVFIFLALDWKDERKRRQHQKYMDMALSKIELAKSKIDDLTGSIERLYEVSKSVSQTDTLESIIDPDAVAVGNVMEYLGDDGIVEPVPLDDAASALGLSIPAPDNMGVPRDDSLTIDESFKEGVCDDFMLSPAMVKGFKQMYLCRPDDMFRTVEGEQIIVRRFHKNLLRKLVGASDDYNLTVNGYVDNILHSHFMLYKGEINSLLSDNDRADLKRDSYDWA